MRGEAREEGEEEGMVLSIVSLQRLFIACKHLYSCTQRNAYMNDLRREVWKMYKLASLRPNPLLSLRTSDTRQLLGDIIRKREDLK